MSDSLSATYDSFTDAGPYGVSFTLGSRLLHVLPDVAVIGVYYLVANRRGSRHDPQPRRRAGRSPVLPSPGPRPAALGPETYPAPSGPVSTAVAGSGAAVRAPVPLPVATTVVQPSEPVKPRPSDDPRA
jgi:hypothetical protein